MIQDFLQKIEFFCDFLSLFKYDILLFMFDLWISGIGHVNKALIST